LYPTRNDRLKWRLIEKNYYIFSMTSKDSPTVRIHLADDHNILREGIASLIRKQSDWRIVSESNTGPTTIEAILKTKPDIALMDVSMPELDGIAATREIVKKLPSVKVIALTVHAERYYVVKMLEAGASGYLLKNCLFDELAAAVRTALEGKVYLSPDVADRMLAEGLKKDGKLDPAIIQGRELTERETEVLHLLVEGRTTKEIGDGLDISAKTVETHRRNIYAKLEIDNLPALTKFALREGFTGLE
jgi:DNA-binding NarL/FixJ family response regulator